MKSRAGSNTIAACLIALLVAAAALVYVQGSVGADDGEKTHFNGQIEHPFGETTVKGAPFSAKVVFENTTLTNGVRVARKATGALYRDSEGRTRQDFPREESPEIAMINDGVAGVIYHLHMFQRTASKVNIRIGQANKELEEHHQRMHEERAEMEKSRALEHKHSEKEIELERRLDSLGVQNFEGVQAEVTRSTIKVPAGRHGNDQPFDIVSETWYSPELQIVVLQKRSDPRMGEMIYRLENISRSEPARSLFEAPADFRITEEKTEFRRKERHK